MTPADLETILRRAFAAKIAALRALRRRPKPKRIPGRTVAERERGG